MANIIFIAFPSVGHTNAIIKIGERVVKEGHNCYFITPKSSKMFTKSPISRTLNKIECKIAEAGILKLEINSSFLPIIKALILTTKSGYDEFQYAMKLFHSKIDIIAKKIIKKISTIEPDIIVSDFSFPAAHIVAKILNIPLIPVYHSGLPFTGKTIPPLGFGLPISSEITNDRILFQKMEKKLLHEIETKTIKAFKKFEIELKPGFIRKPYKDGKSLVLSHPIIEAPRENLSNEVVFTGPICQESDNEGSFQFLKNSHLNKIYISLGTAFNKRPNVYDTIIKSLDNSGNLLIVSAGESYNYLMKNKYSNKTFIYQSVPQLTVLKLIDYYIGHGGNNSTNEALYYGKTMIIIPIGGEQGDNSRRIEFLGVGICLSLDELTTERLRYEFSKLKSESRYVKNAEKISRGLQKLDGLTIASKVITESINSYK